MLRKLALAAVAALGLVAGACGSAQAPQPAPATALPAQPQLEGTIIVDGSSTVAPITQAVAEEFQKAQPGVRVAVGISGSGGGFKKFCPAETDISDASRPIKDSEKEVCAQNGVEFIELPVAFDGLAVMVNPANDWVDHLTVEELRRIWEPAAEAQITSWSQVRPGFPERPLVLYGPGVDSGTYDYFTEAIVGEEGASRGDFTPSEDDNVLVQGIAGEANALGFFGLAYYEQNRDLLKLVPIDGGAGPIQPSQETVAGGTYQPLSRPIFIYVNKARADQRPALDAFVDFYLENARSLVGEVGYIPLTDQIYALAGARFSQRVTGSIFEGGSTVGVSLPDLLADQQ